MTNNASFDQNALAAVKPGIEGTLAEIAVQLERFFSAPANNAAALEVARVELRRMLGVLKMVGLEGVAVFCNEFELALGELAANPQQVSEMQRETLPRAVTAIQDYLHALANGAGNASLRLFPQYQELQQLRGMETSFEMDLFYPNLAVQLPQHLLSTPPPGDARANLKVLRSQYQQALLRWLRQEDVASTIQQMQQALDGVMHCVPQDDGRAFWWIGCGLLDCIKLDGLPPELNARKLLGRIDQQIRTVAEGNSADVRPVLNEMLYLIARSHAVSKLVEEIKLVYALDDYLPELPTLPPGVLEQLLSSMRDQLRVTEECWEKAVQGDEASCEQFMKHAEQLVMHSEKLDRNTFQYLAKQIQLLSEYASTPEHARLIAIDMAMALLLLNGGTENYNRLGKGFQEQARILSERMQAAIKQQPEDIQQLGELVDLHYQMEQGEVMIPLANEMLVNLQHVEQGLNAYFSGAIPREELPGLLRLLSQIRGGLRISSLDMAEQLLLSIQNEVHRFAQSNDTPKPAERYALADAMSALENYMQHLTHGQASDVSSLQRAAAEIARLHQAPAPAASVQSAPPKTAAPAASVPPAPPKVVTPAAGVSPASPKVATPVATVPSEAPKAAAPVASVPSEPPKAAAPVATVPSERPKAAAPMQRPTDEDQELIDIFLEEAREVLGIMRDNLEICQLHPGSIDPLVTIRRGFHTLKGSGRMVGLTELGEVAWCVERAMNKWLQDNKPATTGLLRFINAAVQAFAGWVEVLSNQGELHIEAGELIATAQQIENGLYTEAAPAESTDALKVEVKPEPISTPAPEPEPEPVQLPDLEFEPIAVPVSEPENPPAEMKAEAEPELALLPDLEFEPLAVPVSEPEQSPAVLKAEIEPELALAAEAASLLDLEFNFEIAPAAESAPSPSPAPEFDFKLDFELEPEHRPEAIPEAEAEPGLGLVAEAQPEIEQAPAPETKFDAAAEFAEEVVMVGEVALSKALFNIASSEAVQNVAILQEQFDALSAATHPVVQYDFMRAAHTLVGLNRTMGFEMVVDLAYALENWLRARVDQPFSLSEGQLHLLEQAITVLGEMVLSICDQQMPQSHSDLVGQLHADIDKLGVAVAEPLSIPDAELQSIKAELLRPAHIRAEADMPQKPEEISDGRKTVEGSTGISEPVLRPEAPATDKPAEAQAEIEEDQVQDDIDEQLLPVFLEEADDLCPKIGERLRVWREQPQDEQQVQSLKRLLHTMKGSSRMVGAMRIGETAHEMEDLVSAAVQVREEAGYWDALDSHFDLINALLEELRGGKAVVMPTKAAATEAAEIRKSETGRRATDKQGERIGDRRATDHVKERVALGNVLRVRSEVVDKLVNDAGEISVARSRMETELRSFKDSLLELTASVMRLRHQLREVEIQAESQMQARVSLAKESAAGFDPLEFDRFTRLQELTRFMNESVHDVQTIQHTLLKNLDETAAVLQVQGRLSRELQQNLMNVRMVSFNSIADRLYRIVRQTGKELNKRANLELKGTGVELDRSVLEKMVAPFEHLLRNSIVHGLEIDQLRVQSGKHPIGEIRLSVRQESNEVVFEFSDDGSGLNYDKLKEKAIAKGMFEQGAVVSDDQLAQLIFTSGISTAAEITEIAGRGVGMDVVRSEIVTLGGTIDVKSKRGEGTQFIIRLPLTLAVTQVLLVRSGESTYAIPSTMVEQVRQVKSADMNTLNMTRQIEWQETIYPLHYLSQLLSDTEIVQENYPRNSVLLLRSGEYHIALHVDELLGNQEAIVKNIGPQLARLSGIAGASVLGNGTVVLILNPPQLAQRASIAMANKAVLFDSAIAPKENAPESVKPLVSLPLIMVVDDSLTVRKITSRMLTRAGYQVVTATDGVDALEKLEDFTPDVMLLDIEMPRMDGFALARELRRDPKTQSLPIIMITSRTADKHRDYAMQLGVNTYLGKPYQEDELLQNIADFVAEHKLDA